MNRIGDKGQVWVETVIYTLIGLAIIGLVLAGALPKINAKKDEIMIDQTIEALGEINNKIYEVQRTPGERRVIALDVKKGKMIVNPASDTISWILESSFPYSEVGIPISIGKLNVTTTGDDPWTIELEAHYNIDIEYDGNPNEKKQFDVAPTPYSIMIENKGKKNNNIVIDFSEG